MHIILCAWLVEFAFSHGSGWLICDGIIIMHWDFS